MLTREIGAEYLAVGKYVSENRLYTLDSKRKTKVIDVTRTRNRMRKFTKSDARPLIVDTHHPEGIIPNNVTTLVLVLRCDPTVLIRRLQRKKWRQEKIRENVMTEILDYCFINAQSYYAIGKVVQLDTSRSSVKRSVKTAKNILSGTKPASLHVDWLWKLEKDESLSKYLRC